MGVLTLITASGIATSTASASGPYWHVNGKKLGQGETRQVKLQMKGTGVISVKISEGVELGIECKTGLTEGATIAGQGKLQGQGKARFTFTQCRLVKPQEACTIEEPVTTSQLKYQLGINPNNKQQKFVELFVPKENHFLVIKFVPSSCVLKEITIDGSVAAEVMPTEKEGQEALLSFPAKPITEVLLEQQVAEPSLDGGAVTLGAFFGARLATGEPWGVFGQ